MAPSHSPPWPQRVSTKDRLARLVELLKMASSVNAELYAEIRSKKPISSHNRKALRSHWSPKIAKAICRIVYPDFQGTYEQHLWLLAHKAAADAVEPKPTGWTTYAWEAKEKGILFLMPYPRIEDTRSCSPSH